MFYNILVMGVRKSVRKCHGILVAWLRWLFTGRAMAEQQCTATLFRRSKATVEIITETETEIIQTTPFKGNRRLKTRSRQSRHAHL